MNQNLPMIEARKKITQLPEEFERIPEMGAITVTRRGKPVLAIMPWELYETLMETVEILGDKTLMEALRQSIEEMEQGVTIPWEKAKKELGD